MPVYEFRCQDCGADFTVRVARMGDTAPCPKCGSLKVGRRMSSFARGGGGAKGASGSSGFS